jgi:hypothetical protein
MIACFNWHGNHLKTCFLSFQDRQTAFRVPRLRTIANCFCLLFCSLSPFYSHSLTHHLTPHSLSLTNDSKFQLARKPLKNVVLIIPRSANSLSRALVFAQLQTVFVCFVLSPSPSLTYLMIATFNWLGNHLKTLFFSFHDRQTAFRVASSSHICKLFLFVFLSTTFVFAPDKTSSHTMFSHLILIVS